MATFYFTYGSDHWASGGWTEVEAESMDQACDIFSAVHPRRDGYVACGGIYDEATFSCTKMAADGNLGKRCVEWLRMERWIADDAKDLAAKERCGPDV